MRSADLQRYLDHTDINRSCQAVDLTGVTHPLSLPGYVKMQLYISGMECTCACGAVDWQQQTCIDALLEQVQQTDVSAIICSAATMGDEQGCVMHAALEGESPGSMSAVELPSTNDTASLDCLQRLDKSGFVRYSIWQKRRPLSVCTLHQAPTPTCLLCAQDSAPNAPLACRASGAHSACACTSVWHACVCAQPMPAVPIASVLGSKAGGCTGWERGRS